MTDEAHDSIETPAVSHWAEEEATQAEPLAAPAAPEAALAEEALAEEAPLAQARHIDEQPHRNQHMLVRPSLALAMAVVAGLGGGIVDHALFNTGGTGAALTQLANTSTARPADSVAALAAKVSPSVVNINVESDGGSSTGSGFVIRSDGYILTNHHVIAGLGGNARITVAFADGSKTNGTVVGSNSAYDLAVVKVDKTGLPAVTLGNSSGVVVGDPVIAIGSPLGLQGTVTSGIVSALNRPVTAGDSTDGASQSYFNGIQTDAAINPGNSGGPLIDGQGAVIGVNSAIASLGSSFGGQSGSIGLGFAIPINQAKRIAEEIIKTGKSQVPVMGISLDMQYANSGARVASVSAGQGAQRAGLKAGDIITSIDGNVVTDATALIVDIRAHQPGDVVKVTTRAGKTYSVTLGANTSTN